MNKRGVRVPQKDFIKDLSISLVRTPFKDFTNSSNMSTKNKKVITNVNKDTSGVCSSTKIPIYKQQMKNIDEKNKSDLYEFDESDSEVKKVKTRKPRKQLNNSAKFNRTMYGILQKLEKLEKKKTRKPREKKIALPVSPSQYEINVSNALKRVMEKVKNRNLTKNKENVNDKSVNKKELQIVLDRCTITNVKVPNVKQDVLKKCAINNTNIPLVPQTSSNINILSDILINPAVVNDDHYNDCNDYTNYESDNDRYFGFGSDYEDNDLPRKEPLKHNISNCTSVSQLSKNSFMHTPRRPNAQSTMIHNIRNSPWRLSAAVTRNPHFLLIKNNSLPSLKQDMVLNHSEVDKFEENFSKTPKHVATKPIIQTSILDYMNCSDNSYYNQKINKINSSLFDYDQFVTKPRHRTVLGVIHNNQVVSTPLKNTDVRVPPPDVSFINSDDDGPFFGFDNSNKENEDNSSSHTLPDNYNDSFFGFDSSNNEDKENSIRPSVAKPLRLNVEIGKFYRRKQGLENSHTLDDHDDKVIEEVTSDMENTESQDCDTEMHLFEETEPHIDMSITIPNIRYERKRRRRLFSNASDHSDDDKPKKRKKDIMTKAEEDEMEKWAAEFNAMCQEVDKHQLEIE